jgi:superfamily II DNA helicase RecQ
MTLNMRFSQGCEDFRVSAFGFGLEVAATDGAGELVIDKVDGCVHFELRDIDVDADSIIEESTSNLARIDVAHVPNAELFSRLDTLRGRLKVSMAYRMMLVVSRVSYQANTDGVVYEESKQSDVAVTKEAVDSMIEDSDSPDGVVIEKSASYVSKVDEGAELFAQLAGLRRQLSKEQGVPPYIIFHDKTLWDMARALPEDLSALYKIGGVGKKKLERYGNVFLEAIREYRGVMLAG